MLNRKIWDADDIKQILARTDKTGDYKISVFLVQLYSRQTAEEKTSEYTKVHNGEGFNKVDAPILSNLAKLHLNGQILSSKQIWMARKKLVKYSKQIAELANEHERTKAE